MDKIHPAIITSVVILAIVFGASPTLYAVGKWHCYWFASAPACWPQPAYR